MERRGLLLGRRRGDQGLRVLGEVLRSVGRVEALGENNEFGSSLRRLQDLAARVGEVGSFVGTWHKSILSVYRLPST